MSAATTAVPLRVSYLIPQFPVPTETFAVSDIVSLRTMGHDVTVHTMKPPRADEPARLKKAEVPADLTVRRPALSGAAALPARLWKYRKTAVVLIRDILLASRRSPATALTALACVPRMIEIIDEIDSNGSDVVHVFWSRHAGLVLRALSHLGRPAIRSTFVGAYDLVADDFLVDIAVNSAECVFTHAQTNLPYVNAKARGGQSVDVVHRGIPLPILSEDAARDDNLWITASALTPTKNVDIVLRAFHRARSLRQELKLLICGDGPDRPRLEALCADLGCAAAVTFAGHIERSRLFEKMQGSGTFLLLSTKASERLPNVLKEALWSGCQVISSRTEGIEELIPDSGIGIVLDPHDPDALEAAIASVLSETVTEAAERRVRARRLVAERFSSLHSMARYVARWQELRAAA